jgi:hypothetical protein
VIFAPSVDPTTAPTPPSDDRLFHWLYSVLQVVSDALPDAIPAVSAVPADTAFAATAAGIGALGAVVVATVNLRIDYVARRDQRVSALVSHFMSSEVANARDLLTQRESRFHTAKCRHSAFILLWSIERVSADIDAFRPSLATQLAYRFGRRPRQANGVEILYANLARVTRCLNRYFRSDASNSYFKGSVQTANGVLAALPDWNKISGEAFPTQIVEQEADHDYLPRAIYTLIAPTSSFEPPKGTGTPNRFQSWQRDRRLKRQNAPFAEQ